MSFNTCALYIHLCNKTDSPLSLYCRVMPAAKPALSLFLLFLLVGAIIVESSDPMEQTGGMQLFANFKKYPFHSVLANILKSMSAIGFSDCAHFCLLTKRCVSFNIQAKPDHSQRYHCELLETDLFNSPHKFQGNRSFHHYARQTPCMEKTSCKNGKICLPDYQMNSYHCKCSNYVATGERAKHAKSCSEHHKSGHTTSGVYKIDPDGLGPFDVFCDQTTTGGGWTVSQKRLDGSVDFYRGWADYKQGFGDLCGGEFWLGLDKIHRLTSQTNNTLRVELEDFEGNTNYTEYDMFAVSGEASKYQLTVENYSGTAGDSLSYHRGMAFTTKDRDNDHKSSRPNCAVVYKGAWWYNDCHKSNLNGLYHHGQHSSFADGVNWNSWKGYHYSAKRAEMKIRPVGF